MSDIADFGTRTGKPDDIADFGQNQTPAQDTSTFVQPETFAQQTTNPDETMAKANASLEISRMTGMSPFQIVNHFEGVAGGLWPGQSTKPANVFERIKGSVRAMELNHEKNQIGARMALRKERPDDAKRLAEINASLPLPDETLKMVPNALLSFLYSNLYQPTKASVVGRVDLNDTIEKVAADAAIALASGFYMPAKIVNVVGEITEQTAGASYIASIESGMDRSRALGVSIAITALSTAANAIPMARAVTAGARTVAERAGAEAIKRGLLSGTIIGAIKAAGEQAAYGYGLTAANVIAPEIAKAIGNSGLPQKDAQELLTEIGIEGTLQTGIGIGIAGVSIGTAAFRIRRGGPIDLAMREQARKAELIPETAQGPTEKSYVPAAPGEQKIGDILAINDAQAVKLDEAIRSAESSPDYIQNKDIPSKQAVQIALDEYKAKLEARDLTKKYIRDIQKVDTTQMRPELAEPVQKIMDNFTTENFSKNSIAKLNELRTQLEVNPEMDISQDLLHKLGELDKTPLKSLSVDDLKTIRDAVLHYSWLQKEAQRVMIEGRSTDKTLAVQKIIGEMGPVEKSVPKTRKAVAGPIQKFKDAVGRIRDTIGVKAERMDLVAERVSPTLRKTVIDPVNEGYKNKLQYTEAFNSEFQQKTQTVKDSIGDLNGWLREKTTLPLSYPSGAKINIEADRAHTLALYMHAQNEGNRRHILEGGIGFKFSGRGLRDKIYRIDETALFDIEASVNANPNESKFVKAVAELLNRTGKDQAKVYLEQNGIPLELVDAYYHIETMPVGRGSTAEQQQISTQAKKAFYGIGQSKGQLKPRTDSSIPLYLNPIYYDLAMSRDHAAAYVNLEAPLRNASRILSDMTFKDSLRERTGPKTHQVIVKALKDMAGQSEPISDFEMGSLRVRNRMSTAYMAIPNIFVPMKQPAALLRYWSGGYVRPRYLLEGMYESIMHPKTTENTLRENSPLYANRSTTGRSREVTDVLRAGMPGGELGGRQGTIQKLMGVIGWADTRGSVRPGMRGAVLQVIDDLAILRTGGQITKGSEQLYINAGIDLTKVGSMTPDQIIDTAYKYAEYATEQTQTSGNPLLQSDIQRGGAFQQMYTQFMSEGFTAMNLRRRAYLEAKQANNPVMWGRFAKVMLGTLVLEPMYELAINRLRRAAQGTKQPKLEREAVAQILNYLFSGIPVANQIEQAIVNKVVMGWNVQSNSMTPIDNLATAVVTVINLSLDKHSYTNKKKSIALAKAVAEVGGLMSGLPLSPTIRTAESVGNIMEKLGTLK